MKFQDIPYSRPNVDELEKVAHETVKALENAASAQEQLDAYRTYDDFTSRFYDQFSVSYIRNSIDTRDEFYAAENDFANNVGPACEALGQEVTKALLNSRFRPELEARLGKLAFDNMEMGLRTMKPEIIELMQEESQIQNEYQKLSASAVVEFDGQTLPMPKLGPYMDSHDRGVRRAAYEAQGKWYDIHRDELDGLFDRLIKNRNAQGRAMGHDNYIPLAYDRLGRNCFSPKDVAAFREQIANDIVPVVSSIKKQQASRLGLDKLNIYDNSILFPDGNAAPLGAPADILAAGRQMYQELSPETAEFAAALFDGEFLDVLSKEGKAPGGYCANLLTYKSPFIFANFNGTSSDVDVLTHEGGHAFEFYRTDRMDDLFTCQLYSTGEICECHSMAMEFLTAPWYERFFGKGARKYEYKHCADALAFLAYGAMIDEFEHLSYENGNWSPEERNRAWSDLEKKYYPWVDMDGLPFFSRGGFWQAKLHVYMNPLYYIGYCMAQTVAFQFWIASMKDYKDAWKRYLQFIDAAGTKDFNQVVTDSGLKLPYAPGCMKYIGEQVSAWLDANPV